MKNGLNVWVRVSFCPGDTNNRLAIAQALSPDNYHLKKADLTGALLEANGVDNLKDVTEVPDVYIVCEQGSNMYVQTLRKLGGDDIYVVGLQTPDLNSNCFDHDLGDEYDLMTDMQILFEHHSSARQSVENANDNIIRKLYDYAPTRVDENTLAKGLEDAPQELKEFASGRPVYLLVLGNVIDPQGAFGHINWESFPQEADAMVRNYEEIAKQTAEAVRKRDGVLMVTTSPRTEEDLFLLALKEFSDIPTYIYDWSEKEGKENPYLSMLALAERIVVSADSVSCVADVMATGKPAFVYAPQWKPEGSERRQLSTLFNDKALIAKGVRPYMRKLAERGYVLPMRQLGAEKLPPIPPPINAAAEMANDIRAAYEAFKAT